MKIRANTEKGYIEIKPNSIFDGSYPNSKTRRGRVIGGGKISPTLNCSYIPLIYLGERDEKNSKNKE